MPANASLTPDLEIDLGRYEVRRRGRRLKLERKPMELLILLAQRHGQLVSRKEIEAALWGPEAMIDVERSINNSVRKIRGMLGDRPGRPRFLETVFGKGYRFVGAVTITPASPSGFVAGQMTAADPRVGDERPHELHGSSLVVLPFIFLGGTEQQRGLCLGFADALISALGNLERFFVLPTSAVIKYAGATDPATVASRFGVRFVLQGTIQGGASQSRISVQLFDVHMRGVAFSQKYDLQLKDVFDVQDQIAVRVADALKRRFAERAPKMRDRYSRNPTAYAEFMKGYGGSSSDDAKAFDDSIRHFTAAVTRDPQFALAHAMLSFVCANKHFEFDPSRVWLEKAEFHAQQALELDPQLPEAHLAWSYILWGPSKGFQHLEAIAELRRALALQPNLPHAHNRLGSILVHIGLIRQARDMYERGRSFEPRRVMSHGITQAYLWGGEYELARKQIEVWRAETPGSKYPVSMAPLPPLYEGDWDEAEKLIRDADRVAGDDPWVISLLGLFHALRGEAGRAIRCAKKAAECPKSFGHMHHAYYHIASIYAVLRQAETSLQWLERAVEAGFACWSFFRIDSCLRNLQNLPRFKQLLDSLEARYAAVVVD